MTTDVRPLGTAEIIEWLNGAAQHLNQGLTGPARDEVVAELRAEAGAARAPFRLLAGLALLDDCLRVVHLAIEADGLIEDDEIAVATPLLEVAASRYRALVPRYEATSDDPEGLVEFLRAHRNDTQPFGHDGDAAWRGLRLCRRIGELTRNDELVRDHERMLVRIMDALFAGRDSASERAARHRLRALFEARPADGVDPRATVFCRPDGPEVFSSVAHGSQIFERDPFDVESIHADARAVFETQLAHAVTPAQHGAGHGRTVLVLGTAGSGKTHLLRALRATVHARRLGYVGYLQASSDVGDYSRYVLAKLIDSLEHPYDAPELAESALLYLSDGLAEHADVWPSDAIERLRSQEIAPGELPTFLGRLVDRLLRSEALQSIDGDVLQALLLLQRRDPAVHRRIVKFLRCESLTAYEQQLLGGLAPRAQPEDPARMIEQLGRLVYELHQAALVLLVDQIEDAIPDAVGYERVQRAIDVVRRLADAVPSAVVVIACLEDVYDQIRGKLHQSVVDRLERDPAPVRLTARRGRDEIEAMLVSRLQYLYETFDVAWREDDPCFPFRAEQLDALTNQRARDCLAYFHRYQDACVAAGAIVEAARAPERPPVPPTAAAPAEALGRAWNDALTAGIDLPDDDDELLRLVERGVRACAFELGVELQASLAAEPRPRLTVVARGAAPRVIEVCNRQAQGGHLGAQIEALRRGAPAGHVPVALRTSDFSFGPKTAVARLVGELVKSGGVALSVEEADLRATAAFDAFTARHGGEAGFAEWRRTHRPLARLPLYRRLLDEQVVDARAPVAVAPAEPPRAAPPAPAPPAPPPAAGAVRLGVTPTMRAEPVVLDPEGFKLHAAFLGSTGSGKTTIALHVIEQLLARGVSALLVDRKGDLARYASERWWDEVPDDAELAARKRALRERVDVDLYTPGDAGGRPLRIPVIPPGMREMSSQERDQVAKTAAGGLAAMIGYGRSEVQKKKTAILKKAIELHADVDGSTLEDLRDTIGRPDPELLAAVGNLTRHFAAVAEDLDMLGIQRGDLLSGPGELLDVPAMLAARPGRARLAIVSAVALSDVAVLQFWVSRLLVELGRMVRRAPSPTLRAVAFLDEADTYIPATGAPPTKEPLFDLLRRARSGGLGVLLASQNPGDFDYKARDNVATWLVGRIAQDRAIEKMRNLIGAYPNVAARLAHQGTGSFFLLNAGLTPPVREVSADRSLMRTEQLPEDEIAVIARERRS